MRVMNIAFHDVNTARNTVPCVYEHVLELKKEDYQKFLQDFEHASSYIKDLHSVLKTDRLGVNTCLLVTGQTFADGILIRKDPIAGDLQFANVPNARMLVKLEQYPSLKDFDKRMIEMSDYFLQASLTGQLEGTYHIPLQKIQSFPHDGGMISEDMLAEMLADRAEISYAEIYEGDLYINLDDPYVVKEDHSGLRVLTQKDVDIMCAYHTLWLNGVGGEQADFSGCLLHDIDISGRNLDRAIFVDAKISECKLDQTYLNHANCEGLRIYNCAIINMMAEGASFRNAQIKSTELSRCMFTGSDFTNAKFQDCYASTSRFSYATFEDAAITDSDIRQEPQAPTPAQTENSLTDMGFHL